MLKSKVNMIISTCSFKINLICSFPAFAEPFGESAIVDGVLTYARNLLGEFKLPVNERGDWSVTPFVDHLLRNLSLYVRLHRVVRCWAY